MRRLSKPLPPLPPTQQLKAAKAYNSAAARVEASVQLPLVNSVANIGVGSAVARASLDALIRQTNSELTKKVEGAARAIVEQP